MKYGLTLTYKSNIFTFSIIRFFKLFKNSTWRNYKWEYFLSFLARLLILIKKGGLLQLKFGVVGVGVGVGVSVGVNIYLWAR